MNSQRQNLVSVISKRNHRIKNFQKSINKQKYCSKQKMQEPIVSSSQSSKKYQKLESDNDYPQSMFQKGLYGQARVNFIKKVYSVVGVQLLFTIMVCFVSTYIQGFMRFQVENPALMYVSLGVMIGTEIGIFCFEMGRKHPYSMVALGLFTIAQAYIVSFIAAMVANQDGGAVVVMAALMTLGLVSVLTIYAYYTKTDFTTPWAVMLAFVTSLVMFMMFFFINWTQPMVTFYCSVGIFVFGLYLIIDTQLIMGNRSFAISMDDYVVAALLIYIDIIQLFLYILTLLGGKK